MRGVCTAHPAGATCFASDGNHPLKQTPASSTASFTRPDPAPVGGRRLAEEITELLDVHVGTVCRAEQRGPGALRLESIMTDVADRGAVVQALEAELDGGPETGFLPSRADGAMSVSFVSVVVHATRT
jgi:hypothetical protein